MNDGNNENLKKKVVYYENGKVKSEVYLKDNKPDGIETTYYESGRISGQYEWYRGIQKGNQSDFYDFHIDTVIMETANGSMLVAISAREAWGYVNGNQEIVCQFEFGRDGQVKYQKGNLVLDAIFNDELLEKKGIAKITLFFPLIEAEIMTLLFEIEESGSYKFIDTLNIDDTRISNYIFEKKQQRTNFAIISEIKISNFHKTDTTIVVTP